MPRCFVIIWVRSRSDRQTRSGHSCIESTMLPYFPVTSLCGDLRTNYFVIFRLSGTTYRGYKNNNNNNLSFNARDLYYRGYKNNNNKTVIDTTTVFLIPVYVPSLVLWSDQMRRVSNDANFRLRVARIKKMTFRRPISAEYQQFIVQ